MRTHGSVSVLSGAKLLPVIMSVGLVKALPCPLELWCTLWGSGLRHAGIHAAARAPMAKRRLGPLLPDALSMNFHSPSFTPLSKMTTAQAVLCLCFSAAFVRWFSLRQNHKLACPEAEVLCPDWTRAPA